MPGLVSGPSSASARAVREKFKDICTKHNDSISKVQELQAAAHHEVVHAVLSSVGLQDDKRADQHVRAYVDEPATLFRFYRRSRYSIDTALDMLTATLAWRLRTDLDSLSLESLHPLYTSPPAHPPLFWANSQCFDRYGRPAGVISLQSLERVTHDDGTASLDECREYIVGCMEGMRRYLNVLYDSALVEERIAQPIDIEAIEASHGDDNDKSRKPKQPLQMVIIFSLQASGMANLELELLPFLLDLLKNHFPGMVGAVYIMHFGWVHSGMWALAKRILPQQALARIFFPNEKDVGEHFAPARLPTAFGGAMDVEINERTNDIMKKYAHPRWERNRTGFARDEKLQKEKDEAGHSDEDAASAPPSPRGVSGTVTPRGSALMVPSRSQRSLSRAGSYDSLIDEFHSVSNSPWNSRSVTPRPSRPTTPFNEHQGFLMSRPSEASRPGFKTPEGSAEHPNGALRMTPSAASKLHHLQMQRGEPSQSRSRTHSESFFVPGTSPNGIASPVDRMSPVTSRPPSPSQLRRRTQSNLGVRQGRNVHFNSDAPSTSSNNLGLNIQGADVRPIQRVGSLRDFRLSEPLDLESSTKAYIDQESSGDESEKSGKAGEMASQAKQRKQDAEQQASKGSVGTGFFTRFRRSPQSNLSSLQKSSDKDSGKKEQSDDDADSLLALSPEPKAPDSPRLQVADIEEPPLAETTRFFSRRSHKFGNLPGHVSPYNASNPFYGYPALPEGSRDALRLRAEGRRGSDATIAALSSDPRRRYHFRRRKRDLVRTLVYLFVLRLLAMHRHVRNAILAIYRGSMRAITVGGAIGDDADVAGSGNVSLQQQHERYERLRNAGTRFSMAGRGQHDDRIRRDKQQKQAQAQRLQPQPLVALGMRKRYILLSLIVMFLLLRRYEWRRRRT